MTPAEKEQACQNLGIASNDQINRIESEFTQLRGDMATVSSDVASAVDNANSALTAANSAKNQAIALMDYVTGVSGDIDAVSAMATTNSGDIGTLSSDVSTLSANVGTISGKNTSQDTKIGELSSSVAGLTNSAVYHEATINNLTTAWTAYSADLRNDFDTFSAAEDAVITAATAAIPGQVSAEVSGQLSGKQDKLTPGVNISISNAGKIDLHNNECSATSNSVAIGDKSKSINNYGFVHGRYATNEGQFNAMIAAFNESASGTYNLVAGNQNVIGGNWNTVVGSGNSVTANNFNFLQGVGNAVGNVQGAHAEGCNTTASGHYTHTEGYNTITNGTYAHAEGGETFAKAAYSHAEGRGTITDTNYQHVEGQYNAPALSALHVIGNGSATTARSNIVETYSDRVVVNGDLINDTKDQVLSQFMFDNTQITGTQGKLITKNIQPYGQFISKNYRVGNYDVSVCSGITGSQLWNATYREAAIVDWEGNVGPALIGVYDAQPKPSAWPTDKLPRCIYNSTGTLNWGNFARGNTYLTELPSGWYNSLTAYCNEGPAYLYSVRGMFSLCTNLTGDVKPWLDFVLTQSGTGQAGASDRLYYRRGMFNGCTGIDNYATLSADPTYSEFFVAV